MTSAPPLSLGGFQLSLAESALTSDTSRGPSGAPGLSVEMCSEGLNLFHITNLKRTHESVWKNNMTSVGPVGATKLQAKKVVKDDYITFSLIRSL